MDSFMHARLGDLPDLRVAALGVYVRDRQTYGFRPHSVNVLTLRDSFIEEITAFLDAAEFPPFGLPLSVAA